MKGIAHYASGIALASFLPQAVQRSAQGGWILVLAGLGAIVPDVLDFRFARYLVEPDVEVGNGPEMLDPAAMAAQVAAAIQRAYEARAPLRVQFHPARLGADLWQSYSVCLDESSVRAQIGPAVTASRFPHPDHQQDPRTGCAPVGVPLQSEGCPEIQVDVFSGSMLAFQRRGDVVEATFLPWHRRWSHSLVVQGLLGLGIGLLWGPLLGLVYALGSAAHILGDQLGHMGGSLFFPVLRRRIAGLRLCHSGDVLPNLFLVWASAMVLLFNMDRFSLAPALNPWLYFGAGLLAPWAVILALSRARRGKEGAPGQVRSPIEAAEVLAEVEEIQV